MTVVHMAVSFCTAPWIELSGFLRFMDYCYSLLPPFSGGFHPQRPASGSETRLLRGGGREGSWLHESMDGSMETERYFKSMYRWIEMHADRYIDRV